MKKTTAAACGFAFVTLAFWAGGYDFDTRGHTAVFWLFYSSIVAVVAALIAGFHQDIER